MGTEPGTMNGLRRFARAITFMATLTFCVGVLMFWPWAVWGPGPWTAVYTLVMMLVVTVAVVWDDV